MVYVPLCTGFGVGRPIFSKGFVEHIGKEIQKDNCMQKICLERSYSQNLSVNYKPKSI